ncbi:MAG: VOC family protein [Thermodesulfobacteriota bacterium]
MENRYTKHGAFSWNELMTRDVEGAKRFYAELFGWELTPFEGMDYNVVKAGGEEQGGIMPMPPGTPPQMPSTWNCYVTVDDVDKTVEKAKSLGGQVLFGPMDIPKVGRFCFLMDPQGAAIAVITYLPMA